MTGVTYNQVRFFNYAHNYKTSTAEHFEEIHKIYKVIKDERLDTKTIFDPYNEIKLSVKNTMEKILKITMKAKILTNVYAQSHNHEKLLPFC